MYKRILVALDSSLSARLALEEALKLAKTVDAILMVACVVSYDLCDPAPWVIGEEGERSCAQRQLDHARDLCARSEVRAVTQIIDAHGASIPGALMQAAQAFEADLIVMGAHGPRDVRRHLIGSVAETVLRSSHVPVLTVRDDQLDDEHDAALAL